MVLPCKEPVIISKFDPNVYELLEGEKSLFNLEYKMYFLLGTSRTINIYNTCSTTPLFQLKDFHYSGLSDVAWSKSGLIVVSSMDGYLTFCKLNPKMNGAVRVLDSEEEKGMEIEEESKV